MLSGATLRHPRDVIRFTNRSSPAAEEFPSGDLTQQKR